MSTFTPAPAYPPAVGECRVLVFARMSRRRKGTALAIRAVERLAGGGWGGLPVRLVLFDDVGVGNERDPRSEIRARVPVEFHLNPTQAELAGIYRGCHVFVSAERRAGWSNTVAEAMASGTPVVCTRSGTTDIALPGETACVTRWRHPWVLARAMQRLAHDPETALALRSRALERIGRFAWPRVADQLEEIIVRRLV